jgi:hypothetical protein
VDDILDGDGVASRLPPAEVRRLAGGAADRAREHLDAVSADTSVLRGLVDTVLSRTV